MRRFRGIFASFTLAEILIVLLILGTLATVMIPDFTASGSNSREDNLFVTLQNLRAQVQLYRMQHGNAIPDLVSNWSPLMKITAYGDPPQKAGPYIQSVPVNPLNGSSQVIDGNAAGPAKSACGFIYDYNNGRGSGQIYATDSDGRTPAGTGKFGQGDFLAY
jgi:general secretion pathway protein G